MFQYGSEPVLIQRKLNEFGAILEKKKDIELEKIVQRDKLKII